MLSTMTVRIHHQLDDGSGACCCYTVDPLSWLPASASRFDGGACSSSCQQQPFALLRKCNKCPMPISPSPPKLFRPLSLQVSWFVGLSGYLCTAKARNLQSGEKLFRPHGRAADPAPQIQTAQRHTIQSATTTTTTRTGGATTATTRSTGYKQKLQPRKQTGAPSCFLCPPPQQQQHSGYSRL